MPQQRKPSGCHPHIGCHPSIGWTPQSAAIQGCCAHPRLLLAYLVHVAQIPAAGAACTPCTSERPQRKGSRAHGPNSPPRIIGQALARHCMGSHKPHGQPPRLSARHFHLALSPSLQYCDPHHARPYNVASNHPLQPRSQPPVRVPAAFLGSRTRVQAKNLISNTCE